MYLQYIKEEADRRGFLFDESKIVISSVDKGVKIAVSQGQLDYELQLLKKKMALRSKNKLKVVFNNERGQPNDLFVSYKGPIEPWEKTKELKKM